MRTLSRWPIAWTLLVATGVGCTPDVSSSEATIRSHGKEQFLYVVAINAGGSGDPDTLTIVGADPDDDNFGKIIRRVDMPYVGDELHHFGYSSDMKRLIVPGLFSGRIHVFDVSKPKKPELAAVGDQLVADSGYIVPHSIIAQDDGTVLATMIGAFSATTLPGGIVRVDDRTGEFVDYFGPGPARTADDLGPKYMYDYHYNHERNRGVSTTFGPPGTCGGGINPGCLGDEVAIWDHAAQRVIQTVNLGANSGALESRWVEDGSSYGYTNTPGTSAVWLWEDEDGDGFYAFHQVLGPEDGLVIPADMLLSGDFRYMFISNWVGNTVQMFDITDRYNPTHVSTVALPHPNMLRLSRDGTRLYVTNSLLSTWDNDPNLGPPRNTDYGLWLFHVDESGMTSETADGSPLVSYDSIQKQTSVGPAGPHMMLFDPSVVLGEGEH